MEQLLLNFPFTHLLVQLRVWCFLSRSTEFLFMMMLISSPRYLKSPNQHFCHKRWRSWTSERFTTSQWFTPIRHSTPRWASSWIRECPPFLWWMKKVSGNKCIPFFYIINYKSVVLFFLLLMWSLFFPLIYADRTCGWHLFQVWCYSKFCVFTSVSN